MADGDDPAIRPIRPGRRLYGRRKGHRLSARQLRLIQDRLVDFGLPEPPFELDALFAGRTQLWLEIGFGSGEHLVHMARQTPDAGFIGCEPFVNGFATALSSLVSEEIANARLYRGDAFDVIEHLPSACVDVVCMLYPDPWPKKRHWKRRLINKATIEEIARILKPGGELRFASDMADYVNWTLRHLVREPRFVWLAERPIDWQRPFPDWPGTRYEAKALSEGRVPTYLTFRRLPVDGSPR